MKPDWKEAITSGDIEAIRTQLASGAEVNALDRYGQTGLMLAAHKGDALVVLELVEHGADLNRTAKFGLSALLLAVIGDHPEVVRVLVEAGADTTLRGSERAAPIYNKTALELAVAMRRARCAEMLKSGSCLPVLPVPPI